MVAMLGSVGMAAALATAGHAMIFAVAYVTAHVVRGVILVTTLHRQRHRPAVMRASRFLFWFLVSGVFWITGGLSSTLHWTFWTIAIVIDLVSAAARYPTPWLGRVPWTSTSGPPSTWASGTSSSSSWLSATSSWCPRWRSARPSSPPPG
ncbi:hypothetical protein GCM10027614_05870 [Micromonospora vulcania]